MSDERDVMPVMGDRCETCGQVIAPTWETDPVEWGKVLGEAAAEIARLMDEVVRLTGERDALRIERDTARQRIDNADAINRDALRQLAEALTEREALKAEFRAIDPIVRAAIDLHEKLIAYGDEFTLAAGAPVSGDPT